MRTAQVFVHSVPAGTLQQNDRDEFIFSYETDYQGPPVSLTMPIAQREYTFKKFPPFFEGLLPEGGQLESLLRSKKIDRSDLFTQLICVGGDLVGAVTVKKLSKNWDKL